MQLPRLAPPATIVFSATTAAALLFIPSLQLLRLQLRALLHVRRARRRLVDRAEDARGVGERLAELGVVGLTVLCVCETFNFPSTALLCLRVFLCVCKGAYIYICIRIVRVSQACLGKLNPRCLRRY